MATVHFNRCKNCRMWGSNSRLAPGQFRAGAPSRKSNVCNLRLRDTEDKAGNPALMPSVNMDDKAGPRYGTATSPHASCKYFVRKNMPYRRPAILDIPLGVQPMGPDLSEDVNLVDEDA